MPIPNSICFGTFLPDDIFPFVAHRATRQPFNGHWVKVGTDRLQVFKANRNCVACGIEGIIFLLEKQNKDHQSPHLNLYGWRDDTLVLMTKDHIIPKSKGGKNELSNYQTMCVTCNNRKSNMLMHDNLSWMDEPSSVMAASAYADAWEKATGSPFPPDELIRLKDWFFAGSRWAFKRRNLGTATIEDHANE
jgi:5-methylcytosine-specific restriction endonuclease McrA